MRVRCFPPLLYSSSPSPSLSFSLPILHLEVPEFVRKSATDVR